MGTVRRVAGMGYQVVEFYSPYVQWTSQQAKEVRALMDDLGISCPSTHNGAQSLTEEGIGRAIELNRILGSTKIIQASAPRGANTLDGWKAACSTFTAAVERLRPLGMMAGFHNHATEWRQVEGQRAMDFLAANTPKDFVLQLDAGTCVEAGADPVAWIRANPGRIRSIHCKDWGADGRGYRVAFGEGDVPWRALFDAAESVGGIEHYLVEQEIAGPDGQFAMAERCMANWKKLRASA
jgi:sugar phosphate isomerase/epimerase